MQATALGGLNRLSQVRQLVLLALVAGSVALGVTVALWSQTPNFSLLFGSLSGKDASEVLEVLQREDIPFRVEPETGAILVASSRVHEARVKLAGDGLPRGSDLGFQMLNKKRAFGTSQFMEQARFQRALEVELARSVSSLDNVQSARVHLAMPKESEFIRNRRTPSASVLLRLYPGRKLAEGEAAAIAHLVSAAVPSLDVKSVQVIDEKGSLLTGSDAESPIGLSNKEFEFTTRLEAAYATRVESILSPMVGASGVRAQVTAELDFTRSERATERFTPNKDAVRSEQLMEESGSTGGVGGVPGALSNQPPGAGEAPEVVSENPQEPGTGTDGSRARKQSTRNYELDRVVDHTVTPSAVIKRLSIAVVIDDRQSIDNDGKVVRESRSEEEMTRFNSLVKEAIGFDQERGDRVSVVNTSFLLPEAAPVDIPELPIWKQAWVLDLAKQGAGGLLVLIIAFGVLRPMMKNLVNRDLAEREMLQTPDEQARLSVGTQGDAVIAAGGATMGEAPALTRQDELQSIDSIRALVAEDPRRVANVVKSWVDGNG